jgi:hypothetical protein
MSDGTVQHETSDPNVERYVAAVAARLGPIPAREQALEELRGHLSEVREENPGIDMREILGDPAAYADELRGAAGFLPYAQPRQGASDWISGTAAAVRAHAPHLAHDLRAFWWGVRGLALGLFVFALIPAVRNALSQQDIAGLWSYYLSPDYVFGLVASTWGYAFGMTVLVALLSLGVLVSVWAGGALARGAGPRWVATVIGVTGVLLGVWLAGFLWALVTTAVFARLDVLIQQGGAGISPGPF